jgi:predicted metalloprotease
MRRRPSGTGPLVFGLLAGLLSGLFGACSESELRIDGEVVGGAAEHEPDPELSTDADPDDVVRIALDDLGTFWEDAMPAVYDREFWPPTGGFVAYGPGTPVPPCGDVTLGYEDIEANALYCPDEDYIAWDRVNLVPDLQREFGPLTVAVVMAHEYAHAVQARAGVSGAVVTLELQADCFAGAWVADAGERVELFSGDGDDLDQALGGLLELRDTLGLTANDPNAHGTGFDRVSAFQDGFEAGAASCVDYEENPPPVVALPFRGLADRSQQGNLPVDQLLGPLTEDLESFYAALLEDEGFDWDPPETVEQVDPRRDAVECGRRHLSGEDLEMAAFYCVPDETVYVDRTGLVPALDDIGDFAVAGEIARQYAFAAQQQVGVLDRFVDTDLHADCLTGVYTSAQFLENIPQQVLLLSPGDIDEMVISFVKFGGEEVTGFDRTAAFRTGFVEGYDACQGLLVR